MHFKDRTEAGKLLAHALKRYRDQGVVICAIPRGGVVLGAEIARFLNAPLDLIITRKIGHPYQPEYAIAAVAEDGHMLPCQEELKDIDQLWLKQEIDKQRQEARRRRIEYLKTPLECDMKNKIAILVDDGVATGVTIRLAIRELKHRQCKKIVVAVPVAPKSIADQIKTEADELVALDIPDNLAYLGAVGAYYSYFPQLEDAEVIAILKLGLLAP